MAAMVRHATEVPPRTASVVAASTYEWNDGEWLERRRTARPWREPMSIYEVHLGSWRPGLSYRAAADQLVDYVTEQAFTHVEFMPLAEHPFGGSWGYQVTGYYAPTSRYGHPDDLRYLIDRLHQSLIAQIPYRKRFRRLAQRHQRDDLPLVDIQGERMLASDRRGQHLAALVQRFDFEGERARRVRDLGGRHLNDE